MRKQYSWSHINKILLGVSFFKKLYNLPGCMSLFSVHQVMKGYIKYIFCTDSRQPITLKILKKLCQATFVICFSEFEAGLYLH